MNGHELDRERAVSLYRTLLLTRRSEEKLMELYRSGRAPSMPHSSIGQEAVAVGATFALEPQDMVSPSLRSHGAFIARGVPMRSIYADFYKKRTGPSGGKWSYHHLASTEHGVMLTSAMVGGSIPPAVGAGLAARLRGTHQVMVVFFGDGATSRGDFHEAINMAAVLNTPVVFVCENNQYAMSVPLSAQTKNPNIADRAIGYGIPGVIVDGMDVLEVYRHTKTAVDLARSGGGPTLLECKTYRWRAHMEVDNPDDGRPAEELEHWRGRDCVAQLRHMLAEYGYLTNEEAHRLEEEITHELNDAVEFAEKSPLPDAEQVFTDVYA